MNWFLQIHSEHGRASSKRVYGGLLILAAIVALFLDIDTDLSSSILYVGAGLIGYGTTVELARAIRGEHAIKKQTTPSDGDTTVNIDIEQ